MITENTVVVFVWIPQPVKRIILVYERIIGIYIVCFTDFKNYTFKKTDKLTE